MRIGNDKMQIASVSPMYMLSQIGRPAVVVGTSIGGATALDFALNHPEDVAALVLIDAQGFIDGGAPFACQDSKSQTCARMSMDRFD